MKRPVTVLAAAIVGLAAVLEIGLGGLGGSTALRSPTPTASSPSATASRPLPPASSGDGSSPAASIPASPAPSVTPGPVGDVALVPVTGFRAPWTGTDAAEVRAVVAGSSSRYARLELVASEAPAVARAVGLPAELPSTVVLVPDAAAIGRDLAARRDRLAIIRADEVAPDVRALGWSGRTLFGVDRVRRAADWPLRAQLPVSLPANAPFDPTATWTLVAGGDILLDRGVARAVKILGKGVDFPFDGGTVDITGRCKDCSPMGWDLPYTKRTGNAGAMRHLLEGADVAVANFENPAPDAFSYHTKGTRFSADPALIAGLRRAGIDAVSIANNHIGDAGRAGVVQTRRNLLADGIRPAGAGATIAEARKPALLKAGGVTVAILGYDSIAKYYAAGTSTPGSAQLSVATVKADVAAARRAGADVVIVYPHWGTEYDPTPFPAQRRIAEGLIDAGADMVIGNHAHWAGAMEVYKGRPIWYALGNFVFDQTWSEPTMEGMTLELTFRGTTLVQAVMHPHLILDGAQPNLLDPAGDGSVVLGQVFAASKGLLPW